jgi:hypothetical protein
VICEYQFINALICISILYNIYYHIVHNIAYLPLCWICLRPTLCPLMAPHTLPGNLHSACLSSNTMWARPLSTLSARKDRQKPGEFQGKWCLIGLKNSVKHIHYLRHLMWPSQHLLLHKGPNFSEVLNGSFRCSCYTSGRWTCYHFSLQWPSVFSLTWSFVWADLAT